MEQAERGPDDASDLALAHRTAQLVISRPDRVDRDVLTRVHTLHARHQSGLLEVGVGRVDPTQVGAAAVEYAVLLRTDRVIQCRLRQPVRAEGAVDKPEDVVSPARIT